MSPGRFRSLGLAGLVAVQVMLAAPARPGAQPTPNNAPPADMRAFINNAGRDINQFWAKKLLNYRPPADVVMVQVPARTECGVMEQPNASYCAASHKIFWDASLFATQYRLGDFAPVFILAHEWGHLVQRELGLLDSSAGLLPIQLELQADCLAGWYANDAAQRKMLDPGDDDEAVLSLRRAGDNLDSPWFDTRAHGSPGLRIDAFTYGFEGRGCTTDAFWAFLRQRGVDPSRVPQTPAPTSGRLEQNLPKSIGRFGKFVMMDLVRRQLPGATDVLNARYRVVNEQGPLIEVIVAAYASADAARQRVEAELQVLRSQGAQEISRAALVEKDNPANQAGVQVVVRTSQLEYIVWSNRQLLGVVAGPYNVAKELYLALPF